MIESKRMFILTINERRAIKVESSTELFLIIIKKIIKLWSIFIIIRKPHPPKLWNYIFYNFVLKTHFLYVHTLAQILTNDWKILKGDS